VADDEKKVCCDTQGWNATSLMLCRVCFIFNNQNLKVYFALIISFGLRYHPSHSIGGQEDYLAIVWCKT